VIADPPFDAFLSHCSDDKPAVESLARRLRDEGLNPWLDKWNLIPGEPWQPALEEGLRESSACVVFFGPSGVGPWHDVEMRAALSQSVSSRDSFRVIPVLLPDATEPTQEVPMFLQALTWIAFRGSLDDAEAFHRLLCGIRGVEPGPNVPVHASTEPDDVIDPGLLPPAWTVTYRRNPDFTGREDLLESLRSELCSGSPAAVTQAIVGLGGVGKTQLAIEYAYRHAGQYEAVLWVGADGAGQAEANFSRQALEPRGVSTSFRLHEHLSTENMRVSPLERMGEVDEDSRQ